MACKSWCSAERIALLTCFSSEFGFVGVAEQAPEKLDGAAQEVDQSLESLGATAELIDQVHAEVGRGHGRE